MVWGCSGKGLLAVLGSRLLLEVKGTTSRQRPGGWVHSGCATDAVATTGSPLACSETSFCSYKMGTVTPHPLVLFRFSSQHHQYLIGITWLTHSLPVSPANGGNSVRSGTLFLRACLAWCREQTNGHSEHVDVAKATGRQRLRGTTRD